MARLSRALEDPDRGVRYAAVQALGKAGANPEGIAGRLRDPEWCVRREAGWWLRRAGPTGRALVEIVLKTGSDEQRATAAWTLSGFGAASVPALSVALDDGHAEVRREALAALRRIGPEARSTVKRIRRHLEAERHAEKREAALALAILTPDDVPAGVTENDLETDLGPRTHRPARVRKEPRTRAAPVPRPAANPDPALLRGLGSDEVRTRARAALDLGRAGVDAAVLAPRLRDPERDVRIAAALALGEAAGDAAAPLHTALLDANPRVRRAAILSLGRQGAAGATVVPFLADDNLAISNAAFRALHGAGPDVAVPIARALATRSYAVVRYAPFLFESLGPDGAAATEILAGLLGDEDVNVREAAARCLRSIGADAATAVPTLVRALADERLCVVSHAALALGATGLREETLAALDDSRARVRAYAAFALGWAFGVRRDIDQVPFEVRLPVLDGGRATKPVTLAEIEAVAEAPRAKRVPLLRRGIWSKDRAVVVRSAALLTYEDLDAAESERVMEIQLPEGLREKDPADFDELRSIIGSAELPACMMYLCRASDTWPHKRGIFGAFHRIARADEIPAILWFFRNEEPEAYQGSGEITQPWWHSDRYVRESVAQTTGRDPGPDLDELLRSELRLTLEKKHPDLFAPERWLLNRFRPREEDAELLMELTRYLDGQWSVHRRPAAIRALGRLRDEKTEAFLREWAREEDDEDEPHALAALARRGDPDAIRELVAKSREHPTALSLLIEVRPRLAVDTILARLRDPEQARDCALLIEFGAGQESAMLHGVRWPEEVFLGLEPALAAESPPASVLGAVAVYWPLCRTRRLAKLLFAAQSPDELPTWWVGPRTLADSDPEDEWASEHWVGLPDDIAAFLHSVDAERTRTLLRGWAGHEVPTVRRWARRMLLRIGDLEALGTGFEDLLQNELVRILCRGDSPAIREWLRTRAVPREEDARDHDPNEALRCLARLLGWPIHIPFWWWEESPPPDIREAIRGGRLGEAVAATPWPAAGTDLSKLPAGMPVWRRIGLLALGGDRPARAEFWSALRAGRYRWIHYNFDGAVHTLGRDPQVLPHWLADLDSNCCRISDGMAYDTFGSTFFEPSGWDEHTIYHVADTGVGRPPSQHVLELFRLTGGAWVWSPLKDDLGEGLEPASRIAMIPAPE